VLDEYARVKGDLGDGIVITKSYNLGGVEVNYEGTWSGGKMGIPIFNNEDRVAGSQLLNLCTAEMGVLPGRLTMQTSSSIRVGLVDERGVVIEERMRLAIRALFAAMVPLRRVDRGRVKAKRERHSDKRGLRRVIDVSGTGRRSVRRWCVPKL
jgi:hypothetical protein